MDGELDGYVVEAGSKPALILEPSCKIAHRTTEKRARRRSVQRPDGSQHLLHAIAVKISCRLKLKLVVVKSKRLGGDGIARSAILNTLVFFLFFYSLLIREGRAGN
jgi:hypothetical protein